MPSGWSNKENELLLSIPEKDNDNNYKSSQDWNQISQEMSRGVSFTNSVRTYTYGSVRAHWVNVLKIKVDFQAGQEAEGEANQHVGEEQAATPAAKPEEQNRVAQEQTTSTTAEEQAEAEEQKLTDQEQAAAEFAENQRRGQEILDTLLLKVV